MRAKMCVCERERDVGEDVCVREREMQLKDVLVLERDEGQDACVCERERCRSRCVRV